MPPPLKRVGFTLPGPTATTGHAADWGSIRDLLRPHQRLGTSTVVMLAGLLGYTAIAQLEPVYPTMLGLAGGCADHEEQSQPAPKVSEAWGLKVVCSPAEHIASTQGPANALCVAPPVVATTPFSSDG